MTAKQFRIDNLIFDKDTNHLIEVYHIDTDSDDRDRINYIGIENYEPIPITEEWLLKFDFVSNPYQDRYEKSLIHIECDKTRGKTELWIEGMSHIKYVHQLQNLYYAMRGEELTLKQ